MDWVADSGTVVFATNDAVSFLPRVDYWVAADRPAFNRVFSFGKAVFPTHVITTDRGIACLGEKGHPLARNTIRVDYRSMDWLIENDNPAKYVAGLFTGPAACLFFAHLMGCSSAYLYGCDGFAMETYGRRRASGADVSRHFWYGWTAQKGDISWSREEVERWGGGQGTPIGSSLSIYPKHMRYGCGFYEMGKYLAKIGSTMQIFNASTMSPYGFTKRSHPDTPRGRHTME